MATQNNGTIAILWSSFYRFVLWGIKLTIMLYLVIAVWFLVDARKCSFLFTDDACHYYDISEETEVGVLNPLFYGEKAYYMWRKILTAYYLGKDITEDDNKKNNIIR